MRTVRARLDVQHSGIMWTSWVCGLWEPRKPCLFICVCLCVCVCVPSDKAAQIYCMRVVFALSRKFPLAFQVVRVQWQRVLHWAAKWREGGLIFATLPAGEAPGVTFCCPLSYFTLFQAPFTQVCVTVLAWGHCTGIQVFLLTDSCSTLVTNRNVHQI